MRDGSGTVIGVKTLCPSCEVNTFVEPNHRSWADGKKLRIAYGMSGAYCIMFSDFNCYNPDCSAVQKKNEEAPEKLSKLRSLKANGELERLLSGRPDGCTTKYASTRIEHELHHLSLIHI